MTNPDKYANVKLSYAGATIFYSNKKKRYTNTLQITGPTTAKLQIMVRDHTSKIYLSVKDDQCQLDPFLMRSFLYRNILLTVESPFIREISLVYPNLSCQFLAGSHNSKHANGVRCLTCKIQVNCKSK